MLVEAGFLRLGQELVCPNAKATCLINKDCFVSLKYNGEDKVFEHLSGAARYIEKKSLNGWMYWQVEIDGKKIFLSTLRDQYLKLRAV